MKIGAFAPIYKMGQAYDDRDALMCRCGGDATYRHITASTWVLCPACTYAEALKTHGVDYRRDGDQVIALVRYSDASGITGAEETIITSPLHLMQVLGY